MAQIFSNRKNERDALINFYKENDDINDLHEAECKADSILYEERNRIINILEDNFTNLIEFNTDASKQNINYHVAKFYPKHDYFDALNKLILFKYSTELYTDKCDLKIIRETHPNHFQKLSLLRKFIGSDPSELINAFNEQGYTSLTNSLIEVCTEPIGEALEKLL